MKPRTPILLAFLALLLIGCAAALYVLRHPRGGTYQLPPGTSSPFDHSHAAFDRVLDAHVADAQVDYSAIKNNPADLDTFLDQAAAVTRADYDSWSESQQLAFLIDLYNAATIRLIIDHYPLASIKDIGNALVGAWQKPVVRLFGNLETLDFLEHEIIRADFAEPRIHFALVCAAKSCPPLRPEAFTPDKLDAQLDDQGRIFLADTTKNRISPGSKTAYLSAIFDWFGDDFTSSGKPLLEALAPWFPQPAQDLIRTTELDIQFLDYDWSLNGTP